jgi:small-conductance mechanosensitive channel
MRFHNLGAALIAVLLIACLGAWILTRDAAPVQTPKKTPAGGAFISSVDERLLRTARQLASQADTPAEQEQAASAVRLADQQVDRAYSAAIQQAEASPPPNNGPLHQLAAHISELQSSVTAGQQHVAQLTKEAASNASAADRLELAKAQLALDQDELDDAQQDLAREGGDEHVNLQRALEQHRATQHGAAPAIRIAPPPATFISQFERWLALGARASEIEAARHEADKKAVTLERAHEALEGKLAKPPTTSTDDDEEQDAAALVAQLRALSGQRKTLTSLDQSIQDCRQLAGVYQNWLGALATARRGALHLWLASMAAILAVLLAAMLLNRAVHAFLAHQPDRRRLHQLRVVVSIAIQVVAVLLIAFILFGAPTQMPTIIGLATAGLTVVLKDFIVAFFGWFALAGRNGIRLGDWVEIEGVGGEVVEIGLLRTVLLEMGNWTSTGHPTGRRVAFVNSFAIEGHYFNFSTAGQWLWDELQVNLPAGDDVYAMAEQIRQAVERETREDAERAEQEWERVTRQYGTRTFSARPAVDLRPSLNSLTVVVRYITRAPQRYEMKSRLFQAIVELMHKPAASATNRA